MQPGSDASYKMLSLRRAISRLDRWVFLQDFRTGKETVRKPISLKIFYQQQ
jgi:hypothetical protein